MAKTAVIKIEKKHRNKRGTHPNSLANLNLWEKGKSPNPLGNHLGTKHRDAEVRKWTSVESEFNNPITKTKARMSVRDAMTLAMIGAVLLEKNVTAYKALNEEEFGKPMQAVEIGNKDGEPFRTEATTIIIQGVPGINDGTS